MSERSLAELLNKDPQSQDSTNWLSENVWHPFVNGTGLLQIYDTIANKELDIYQAKRTETFSSDWCVRSLSTAAGAILPFVIAGKLTGAGLTIASERLGLEGTSARIMSNESLAQVFGAGLYTFAQKPQEGQSRLSAAAGSMAGFTLFSSGNYLLGQSSSFLTNPLTASLARGTGRIAVGALGGMASYETGNFSDSLQGIERKSSPDEFWQSVAQGAFVNLALPVVQERVLNFSQSTSKAASILSESRLSLADAGKTVAESGLSFAESLLALEQNKSSLSLIGRVKEGGKAATDETRILPRIVLKGGSDIAESTKEYERWMSERIKVVPEDLAKKHSDMASDPFKFMRATYYRWAERFPQILPDLANAPKVNSIGDLHIDNFGTWIDKLGRLVWGANDFDEAYHLPYTNDLVRLATSLSLLKTQKGLEIGIKDASEAILEGYKQGLKDGGKPFVLEDHNHRLLELAKEQMTDPKDYYHKLKKQIESNPTNEPPPDLLKALKSVLPDKEIALRFGHRQAGEGSLGRQRDLAIGEYKGDTVAAEAKSLLASANSFVAGKANEQSYSVEIMKESVRQSDPGVKIEGDWIARSMHPRRSKIDLSKLDKAKDQEKLLYSMGYETANIHLGTKNAAELIVKDLESRDPNWLSDAAKSMTKSIEEDHADWKKHMR